jgi:hypothetical protein
MLLLTSVKSVYIQQGTKYELGFMSAFKVYTTKYTGPIWVGFLVIFIVMFVFPNVVAASTLPSGDNAEIEYAIWFKKFLKYLRFYSVFLGIIGQGAGFIIIRKGEKFLRDEESKIGDQNTNNPI